MKDPERPEKKIFILPDKIMDEAETLEHWKAISQLLRRRADRAKKSYYEDENNPKKLANFLARSMEYYSFGKLVNGYGMLTKKLVEDHTADEGTSPVRTVPPGDLN